MRNQMKLGNMVKPHSHWPCDFIRHIRSQVLFRQCKALGTRLIYFEHCKMAEGRVLMFGRYIWPHLGVTIGFKVPKGNNNVHWFEMVGFMAWVKAGRPAEVEQMIRQLEATRVRIGNLPIQPCAGATDGWISRWVDDYKPWRIWFMVFSPTSCFRPVHQRLARRVQSMILAMDRNRCQSIAINRLILEIDDQSMMREFVYRQVDLRFLRDIAWLLAKTERKRLNNSTGRVWEQPIWPPIDGNRRRQNFVVTIDNN